MLCTLEHCSNTSKTVQNIFFVLKNMVSSGSQYSSPLGMGGGVDGSYLVWWYLDGDWWRTKADVSLDPESMCVPKFIFVALNIDFFSKYFASMCPLFYPERQWLMKSFLSCHSKWSSLKISFSSLRDTKGPDQALCNLKLKW